VTAEVEHCRHIPGGQPPELQAVPREGGKPVSGQGGGRDGGHDGTLSGSWGMGSPDWDVSRCLIHKIQWLNAWIFLHLAD
jgi:hypothetical protein